MKLFHSLLLVFMTLVSTVYSYSIHDLVTAGVANTTNTTDADDATFHTAANPGYVRIVNNLNRPIYLWSVADVASQMYTINSHWVYVEYFRFNPNGGGISIKISTTPDLANIIQWEYTRKGDVVWWDVSHVNLQRGSEFVKAGYDSVPSDRNCGTVHCRAGDENCPDVYHMPWDDGAVRACGLSSTITFTLGK